MNKNKYMFLYLFIYFFFLIKIISKVWFCPNNNLLNGMILMTSHILALEGKKKKSNLISTMIDPGKSNGLKMHIPTRKYHGNQCKAIHPIRIRIQTRLAKMTWLL